MKFHQYNKENNINKVDNTISEKPNINKQLRNNINNNNISNKNYNIIGEDKSELNKLNDNKDKKIMIQNVFTFNNIDDINNKNKDNYMNNKKHDNNSDFYNDNNDIDKIEKENNFERNNNNNDSEIFGNFPRLK